MTIFRAHCPTVHLTSVPENTLWDFKRQCAKLLSGLGYSEALNGSMLSRSQAEFFIPGFGQPSDTKPIALANPLSLEQAILRTSLVPGLLQNACLNFQRQAEGVRLFETGRVFFEDSNGKQEVQRLALVLAGQTAAAHWQAKPRNADFYELTGTLESLAQRLGITRLQWTALRHPAFHPRRAALLISGRTILAWVGEIHPDLADKLDRREPFIATELDVESWHAAMPRAAVYKPDPGLSADSPRSLGHCPRDHAL